MSERIECAVIGAGAIGLAIARRLAMSGREVVVLEAEHAFGTHTSSRNSEVIHAGIYYPTGSLKARLCVAGRKALYRYCAEHDVRHRRIGKVIVACDESELAGLKKYREQAEINGVDDLRMLNAAELSEMEPNVRCVAGFLSPSTGIIDSHGLMLEYLGDAERHGASLALASPVVSGRADNGGVVLEVGGAEPLSLRCDVAVNSAGFSVHVTIDLGGQVKIGPDFSWIDRVDYRFDESREGAFYQAIRRYYPGLKDGALTPGYTGIRPKIHGPGEPAPDWAIQGPRDHGVAGLVNLYGVESPGLTSSLAIADHVARLLDAG